MRFRSRLLATTGATLLGAAAVLTAPGSAHAANLLTNPGFESGTLSGWSCSGGLGSVVSTPVHGGTKALAGAASASDNAKCTQTVAVQPNTTYTLSGWVRGSYVYLGVTGGPSVWASSAGSYTQLSTSFTTGASQTSAEIYLNGWYGQGTYYADDISLDGPGTPGGDTQAPTVPGNPRSTAKTSSSVSLAWDTSTDNTAVTGYDVYRGTTLATTVTGTSATVTGLAANTAYSFTVRARDAAGNTSPASTAVSITTDNGTIGPGQAFFDDFSYTGSGDSRLAQRGWTIRTGGGGPGVTGASWSAGAFSFPTVGGGQVLQLDSRTDGTGAGTVQGEIATQRKFLDGTYAARVYFSDAPVSGGPDGDQVVQTFFTITPLDQDMDPDYSELDFEYLSNGGWGTTDHSLWTTSWETYQNDPWEAVSTRTTATRSYAGWHDLVLQVANGHMKYYIDGQLFADHSGIYYPETLMSININQWFINGGLQPAGASRTYREQVDYVYFAKNQVLTPAQVQAQVTNYRTNSVAYTDTVPAS